MAGLNIFAGHYSKPGPGVRKDEPKKPPFIRFWQLFFRKFSKLIELNLLFVIPVIVVCAICIGINLLGVTQPLLCFIPVVLLSPFIAGLTMITRNFAREDHAFILSDFIDAVKKNWKPFLINGVICYIFGSIIYVALHYYLLMSGKGWMYVIALSISILVAVIFLFAQYYIPVMIITLNLNLMQIYRNALIFAFLGLWRNLMLTVIFAVLFFANFVAFFIGSIFIIIALFLILFIAFAFISYLTNFAVYPLIEKMIIKPYYEKQNAPVVEDTTQNKPVILEGAQGDTSEKDSADPDALEYVFVDGKLVRKYSHDETLFKDKM